MTRAPVLRIRRFERIRTRLRVAYGIGAPEHSDPAESISEGGLYIKTHRVYKVGTRLVLDIEFPERTIRQQGEVAWAIEVPEHQRDRLVYGMGISFTASDPRWPVFFREWKAAADGAP